MKKLEASDLLQIWESGIGTTPALALLPLLAAAFPEISPDQLPRLTIGERDSLLLTQREQLFGPSLEAVVSCPACSENLEFSLEVEDLRLTSPLKDKTSTRQKHPVSLQVAGYQIEAQIPTIADVSQVDTMDDLLERCITKASSSGEDKSPTDLPQEVIDAVGRQLVEADPQADIQLSMVCPACGHGWPATFDIVTFLWSEIHTWAQRMLFEVHQLARAYGWSEKDILALSPTRRQLYLTMIGGG